MSLTNRVMRDITSTFPSAIVKVEEFSPDVWVVDVHVEQALFVLASHPGSIYVVSEESDESPFGSGDRRSFDSIESAVNYLKRLLNCSASLQTIDAKHGKPERELTGLR